MDKCPEMIRSILGPMGAVNLPCTLPLEQHVDGQHEFKVVWYD